MKKRPLQKLAFMRRKLRPAVPLRCCGQYLGLWSLAKAWPWTKGLKSRACSCFRRPWSLGILVSIIHAFYLCVNLLFLICIFARSAQRGESSNQSPRPPPLAWCCTCRCCSSGEGQSLHLFTSGCQPPERSHCSPPGISTLEAYSSGLLIFQRRVKYQVDGRAGRVNWTPKEEAALTKGVEFCQKSHNFCLATYNFI